MNIITPPEARPGVHYHIAERDYRAWPAISPSGASKLQRSPAHYREYITTPQADTPAYRQGRAAHALALEGREAYDAGFVTAPECDRRTKEGKATFAAFEAEAAGRTVLTSNEAAIAEAIAAALRTHPLIPRMIDGAAIEVSLRWDDPETGAACKGRPDALRLDAGTLLDFKTTLDASPGAFARSMLNFSYHVQAAAYLEGLRTLGVDARDFVVIAAEKSPPYACAIYRIPDAALELGARRWREACRLYAECTATGVWPGYSTDLQELALPAWALNEFYQSETEE